MRSPLSTTQLYAGFAVREARGKSDCYEQWASGIAGDADLLRLIDGLPGVKKQPNLVFAAARYVGIDVGPFPAFRRALLDRWEQVREVVLARRTQTNEAGRLAVLLPLLAALPQPLALLEVGASAGLCLYPDRYSYDYGHGRRVDPIDGAGPWVLRCRASRAVPIPARPPVVAWRAGIDLNPLDPADADDASWLDTLIWPGQEDRRRQLAAAIDIAGTDPPRLVRGDLNDELATLAGQAPAAATLVIFHSAVLVYLSDPDRQRFITTVRELPAHWISNEGSSLRLPGDELLPPPADPRAATFVLRQDAVPVAYAGPHGEYVDWLQ